jgi:hypothetical protein
VSIEVTSQTLADHVRVECAGTFSLDEALGIFERTFELAVAASREAALVDIRKLSGRAPTISDRYELAVRIAELQAARTPRIRVALLGHEPMIHPERFGDVVAARRGAAARAFTDEAAALDWLLGRR